MRVLHCPINTAIAVIGRDVDAGDAAEGGLYIDSGHGASLSAVAGGSAFAGRRFVG